VTLNRAAMAEMRKLLLELRPSAIVQTPFSKLLQQLIYAAQGLDEIDADFEYDGPEEMVLNPETQVALYRIAQEAVNNVTKHSGAKHLSIAFSGNGLGPVRLVITDNGRGFDPARTTMGLGMNTMRERAERAGATFEVHSAPGEGTRITVQLAE
jgi:signal transduction histidine kinase